MKQTELYLKTIFCCMACDGEIAKEEVEMIKHLSSEYNIFSNIEIGLYINKWITIINENGKAFLSNYLNELSKAKLTSSEQLFIIDLAIKTIEADKRIEYSEIKFFKKLRNHLSVSDEEILRLHPDKEEFLLPDINPTTEVIWDNNIQFPEISLKLS